MISPRCVNVACSPPTPPSRPATTGFLMSLFESLVPGLVDINELKKLAGPEQLNMTQLALNLAGYINGVARRHAETTRQMFPGYRVHASHQRRACRALDTSAFARLFTANWPQWNHEPEILVRALQLSDNEVWNCHTTAKAELVNRCGRRTGVTWTRASRHLGFARRMTGYKRPSAAVLRCRPAGRHCVPASNSDHPGRQGASEGPGREGGHPQTAPTGS